MFGAKGLKVGGNFSPRSQKSGSKAGWPVCWREQLDEKQGDEFRRGVGEVS